MATINVTEDDFTYVATAAFTAESSGNDELAKVLDKLARRINLALSSNQPYAQLARSYAAVVRSGTPRSWRDMPTTLRTDPYKKEEKVTC